MSRAAGPSVRAIALALASVCAFAAHAQEAAESLEQLRAGGAPQQDPPLAAAFEELAREGIRVDVDRREVRAPGYLLRDRPDPANPVELFLITPKGARHEALGVLECTPSLLNFALLCIGLESGPTRGALERDPMPDEENLRLGIDLPYTITPPQGDRVFCYVRWIDGQGKEHFHAVEDLLLDLVSGETIPIRGFSYVGSQFVEIQDGERTESRFIADLEGNVATIYPTKVRAENCLFDVYCTNLEPYQLVDVDPNLVPAAGTPLEFVFTPEIREGGREVAPLSDPPRPVPDVRELRIHSANPYLRDAPEVLLQRIGARDLAELERMLRRSAPEVREIVAAVFGRLDDSRLLLPLSLALRFDRSPDVRLAAAYSLAELGSEAAVDVLIQAVEESWWEPRESALFALRLLSGQDRGGAAEAWREWAREHFSATEPGGSASEQPPSDRGAR